MLGQAAMLALLWAIGSGPATLLPRSLPAATRLAMAAPLGRALAAALGVGAAYLMPMSVGAWVGLVPLAVVSLSVALVRSRRGRGLTRPGLREALAVAALVLAIGAAADAPLVSRDSLGPMAYSIVDSGYLVDQHDALESHRLAGLTVHIGPQTIRYYRRTTPYDTLSPHDRDSFADLTAQTFNVIPAGYASVAGWVDSPLGW